MRVFVFLFVVICLSGCKSESDTASNTEVFRVRPVTLPNGKVIQAELAISNIEMQRGMMFRDSLPAGRGMLFLHNSPSAITYWMFNVKIPLDIIFIDPNKRVLGVSANTPPCLKKASECPSYGGFPNTQYVLELGGGEAAKNGVTPGVFLTF